MEKGMRVMIKIIIMSCIYMCQFCVLLICVLLIMSIIYLLICL